MHRRRAAGWLLGAGLVSAAAPVGAARYYVGAESQLEADRWRGSRPDPIDRIDVHERLTLGVYELSDEPTRPISLVAHLAVGADFGPSSGDFDAAPNGRRADYNLDFAYLRAERQLGRIDATIGRHLVIDEIGYDALDGATIAIRVAPYVAVEGSAGLAVRRGWSDFGPDIFEPDGAVLSDDPGYVVGAAVESRGTDRIRVRAAFRRLFDDATQRESIGASAEWRPWRGAFIEGGARYDTIFQRTTELRLGVGTDLSDAWRATLRARRSAPTFSADSIWIAFGPEPHDEVSGEVRLDTGRWRIITDGSVRWFDSGSVRARAPGLSDDAPRPDVDVDARPLAWEASSRAMRRLPYPDDVRGGGAHLGVEGRAIGGYGGDKAYGDAFALWPVRPRGAWRPLWMRARLGAVWFDDARNKSLDGVSGWGVAALEWPASETATLSLLVEGHASRFTPARTRVMGRLELEDWL